MSETKEERVTYKGWHRSWSVIATCGVLYFAVVCIGAHNWLALAIDVQWGIALWGWRSSSQAAADAFRGWGEALDKWHECLMQQLDLRA